jgi:hypothetical protein
MYLDGWRWDGRRWQEWPLWQLAGALVFNFTELERFSYVVLPQAPVDTRNQGRQDCPGYIGRAPPRCVDQLIDAGQAGRVVGHFPSRLLA